MQGARIYRSLVSTMKVQLHMYVYVREFKKKMPDIFSANFLKTDDKAIGEISFHFSSGQRAGSPLNSIRRWNATQRSISGYDSPTSCASATSCAMISCDP